MKPPVKPRRPDTAVAEEAVRTLLSYFGDDPDRPGLRDTPKRFLKAWREEWGAGYGEPASRLVQLFPDALESSERRSMVVVGDIRFYSHCEHHIAPFYGSCTIGYIPDPARGAIGLSKLARITDHFARRLQVQERLNDEIADFLASRLAPDVGVVMRAVHMCMCSRGAKQPDSATTTSSLRGVFFDDHRARAEFLSLAAPPGGSRLACF